jgi:hypothetical protein
MNPKKRDARKEWGWKGSQIVASRNTAREQALKNSPKRYSDIA